jgi:DMSO reductase anchor subunit
MGFNEELFTLALKPVTSTTISTQTAMAETTALTKDVIDSDELTSTNKEVENTDKMTTKTKKIVLASVVGLALGVIIFIVIKNRK